MVKLGRRTKEFPLPHLPTLLATCIPSLLLVATSCGGGDAQPDAGSQQRLSIGELQWARQIGGTGRDHSLDLAVTGVRRPVVAFEFDEELQIGDTALANHGRNDVGLVAFSATGDNSWARSWGGAGMDSLAQVVATSDGGFVAIGTFEQTMMLERELSSAGATDIYVMRLDDTGSILWSHQVGSDSFDEAYSVAAGADGSAYIAGHLAGQAVVDTTLVEGPAFVCRIEQTGSATWCNSVGSSSALSPVSSLRLAFRPPGSVFVVGEFSGSINLGGEDLTQGGLADVFMAEFDSESGGHVWSRRMGGIDLAVTTPTALAVDNFDRLVLAGIFSDNVDLGNGPRMSAGSFDVFVATYVPASGDHVWSRTFGGSGDESFARPTIAVDTLGGVYVAGSFERTVEFDGLSVASEGFTDGYVVMYDAEGNPQWMDRFGGSGGDWCTALHIDASGGKILIGTFPDQIALGAYSLASEGLWDAFIATFD